MTPRVIETNILKEDVIIEGSLRPQCLDDYIGQKKAKEIKSKINDISFRISDILEKLATEEERKKGYDIADYLSQLDWRRFRPRPNEVEHNKAEEPQYDYPPEWDF